MYARNKAQSWHQCIIPGMENRAEAKLEGSQVKKMSGLQKSKFNNGPGNVKRDVKYNRAQWIFTSMYKLVLHFSVPEKIWTNEALCQITGIVEKKKNSALGL